MIFSKREATGVKWEATVKSTHVICKVTAHYQYGNK